jgi:dihydroflavonol-4-reductase
MRVAVTGAAGFLGLNLVRALRAEGHDVVAIDRQRADIPGTAELPGTTTWLAADVLDRAAMRAALDGVEVVHHLVAVISLRQEDPVAWRVNTEGVAVTARAALDAGVRRFVHCGSLASFEYERHGTVTEGSPRAIGNRLPVYHRSKFAGQLALARVVDAGLDAVVCHPTGIFGPVDHPGRLSRMNQSMYDAARGRAPVTVAGSFDMVDVRDVAHGFLLAAEKGRTGHDYLLPGHRFDLHRAVALAARAAGRPSPRVVLPLRLLETVRPVLDPVAQRFGSEAFAVAALENLTQSPYVDGSRAAVELGYAARPTEQSIADLVDFLVGAGLVRRR